MTTQKSAAHARTQRAQREEDTPEAMTLLLVSRNAADEAALRRILEGQPWQLLVTSSCAEAITFLKSKKLPIVVCEHELPGGCWKDILNYTPQYCEPPMLIVISRLADEYLWAEVLNLGGYDVLSKPFDDQEVRNVLAGAWLRRAIPATARAASL